MLLPVLYFLLPFDYWVFNYLHNNNKNTNVAVQSSCWNTFNPDFPDCIEFVWIQSERESPFYICYAWHLPSLFFRCLCLQPLFCTCNKHYPDTCQSFVYFPPVHWLKCQWEIYPTYFLHAFLNLLPVKVNRGAIPENMEQFICFYIFSFIYLCFFLHCLLMIS